MLNCNDEKPSDFSQDTWLSLLGLLKPTEYCVTIDHFPIWRRHLAWAKTDGDDLQKHTTQQFSTNMVFMSLLLGAELNVLFNSSNLTTQMRHAMMNEQYHDLKFWIGVVIFFSVFVTITALVGTFTAWRMVSAVSDTNAHCILRSSIGQYVTHLPSRLIVAALYSFLLWMLLFLVDMLSGPLCFILFTTIALLFGQLIISYSAFGRLIIHTGAMGKKQILNPELERSLLPSGLHASLLIKATSQLHRRTSVTKQYRSPLARKSTSSTISRKQQSISYQKEKRDSPIDVFHESGALSADDEQLIMRTAETLSLRGNPESVSFGGDVRGAPSPENRTSLDESLDFSGSGGSSDDTDDASLSMDDLKEGDGKDEDGDEKNSDTSDVTNDWTNGDSHDASRWKSPFENSRVMLGSRRALSRRQSVKLKEEWQNESDARFLYDIPPPPDLPSDDSFDEEEFHESAVFMPRASILNRTKNMKSLRMLAKESIERSSSMSDNDITPEAALRRDNSVSSTASGFFTPVTNIVKMISERNPSPVPGETDVTTSETDSTSKSRKSDSNGKGRRVNFAPSVMDSDCESQRLLSDQQPQYDGNLV